MIDRTHSQESKVEKDLSVDRPIIQDYRKSEEKIPKRKIRKGYTRNIDMINVEIYRNIDIKRK